MLKLLNPELLQQMVDYSFGDQSGVLGGVPNAYMKKANSENREFFDKVVDHFGYGERPMTLFIDNIRLYRRPLEYSDWLHNKPISNIDRKWLSQFDDEDLLKLCAEHPTCDFIIFTGFEDTPLDESINVPPNVIIYAINGVILNDKVHPFPHGIERKMYEGYDHHEILQEMIKDITIPLRELFVCHREDTGARTSLKDMFRGKDCATVGDGMAYRPYLKAIKDHKFVLCPSGNGIESARNWETLYMRRVPIMIKHPYMEELYKDFPVLWVNDFAEVTEELLKSNDYLYEQAQKFDMELLDLDWWFNKSK